MAANTVEMMMHRLRDPAALDPQLSGGRRNCSHSPGQSAEPCFLKIIQKQAEGQDQGAAETWNTPFRQR